MGSVREHTENRTDDVSCTDRRRKQPLTGCGLWVGFSSPTGVERVSMTSPLDELVTDINQQIEYLEQTRSELDELSELVETVDCDHGCGNLSVEGETIEIKLLVSKLQGPARTLIFEYDWETNTVEPEDDQQLFQVELEKTFQVNV
jgi:hypothetical protein